MRGAVESALPRMPSIETHIHRGDGPEFAGVWQMAWLYSGGTLSDEQHTLLAERLARFGAVSVTTKGIVDLYLPGLANWYDPQRPHMVSSQGSLQCGEAAQRYTAQELDDYFCKPLREAVQDAYSP
jgi:hypothetical protein